MSRQLLIEESTVKTKEIKVVLDQNGYKRAKLREEDYDGKVVTLTVSIDDYKYIQEYIGSGDDHLKEIFADTLTELGIPDGYRVSAVFKDSFEGLRIKNANG